MEIVLYILGAIVLVALLWFIITAVRTLQKAEIFFADSKDMLEDIKKDIKSPKIEV